MEESHMKSYIFTLIVILFLLISINQQSKAQDDVHIDLSEFENDMDDLKLNFGTLEFFESIDSDKIMEELEAAHKDLNFAFKYLNNFDFPEFPEIPELPEIPEFPEIDEIHIPHIPEIRIPHIKVPHINHDHCFCHGDLPTDRVFKNLSEDESIKICTIRSIARQNNKNTLPILKKIIRNEKNSAYQYEAVRQLRRYLKDDSVITVLCNVAKSNKNIKVRKKAIHLLGKSKNKNALKTLQDLATQ